MDEPTVDARVNRLLGQEGRGIDRPTLLTSDAGDVSMPTRAPSMWDRARRFVGRRMRLTRPTARGARR